MQAIITCYLLSPVPPKLQLDIPQGIADKITKKEHIHTNQYIFKEAQVSYQILLTFNITHDLTSRPVYLKVCLPTALHFKNS